MERLKERSEKERLSLAERVATGRGCLSRMG